MLHTEGAVSVKAVVEAGKRDVTCIYVVRKKFDRDIQYILKLASERGIKIEYTSAEAVEKITDGNSHGGICAVVGERRYDDVASLFKPAKPFIVLLEGIEDPFNFGDCIRTAYAAGATGILIPNRSWENAVSVVTRASAGASEKITTVRTDDIPSVLDEAKKHGIKVFAAERKDAKSLYAADLDVPLVLAIGGRLRGLSAAVLEKADESLFIPYGNMFRNALSAASACAVMSFEVYRQQAAGRRAE